MLDLISPDKRQQQPDTQQVMGWLTPSITYLHISYKLKYRARRNSVFPEGHTVSQSFQRKQPQQVLHSKTKGFSGLPTKTNRPSSLWQLKTMTTILRAQILLVLTYNSSTMERQPCCRMSLSANLIVKRAYCFLNWMQCLKVKENEFSEIGAYIHFFLHEILSRSLCLFIFLFYLTRQAS